MRTHANACLNDNDNDNVNVNLYKALQMTIKHYAYLYDNDNVNDIDNDNVNENENDNVQPFYGLQKKREKRKIYFLLVLTSLFFTDRIEVEEH